MKKFNPDKELYKIQHGNKNKIILFVISLLIVGVIGYSFALYQVRYNKRIIYTKIAPFSNKDLDIALYLNGEKTDKAPEKDDGYTLLGSICDVPYNGDIAWDADNKLLSLPPISIPNKCYIYFINDSYDGIIDFKYSEKVETYTIPKDGIYKLEVWGAQGANNGGKGGYAYGNIRLKTNDILYIAVGGSGTTSGFNGGTLNSGGGATHIATSDGLLSELDNNRDAVLLVAGGGGASGSLKGGTGAGGSGGGFEGVSVSFAVNYSCQRAGETTTCNQEASGSGGTQTTPGVGRHNYHYEGWYNVNTGSFGLGASPGGGGYYGGAGYVNGSGGSGYIKETLLSNKGMYCYGCKESADINTKTTNTTNVSDDPVSLYAKNGDGAARITFLGN